MSLVITKLRFFKLRGDWQETPATPANPETGWEPPETQNRMETSETPEAEWPAMPELRVREDSS